MLEVKLLRIRQIHRIDGHLGVEPRSSTSSLYLSFALYFSLNSARDESAVCASFVSTPFFCALSVVSVQTAPRTCAFCLGQMR